MWKITVQLDDKSVSEFGCDLIRKGISFTAESVVENNNEDETIGDLK